MSGWRGGGLAPTLLLLLAGAGLAQEPAPADEAGPALGAARLKVELAPREITVGDRVAATLTLVWMREAPVAEPRFPTWQESWGPAEVLETGDVEGFVDQSGRRIYRQSVTLTAFRTGAVDLPPVTVAVPLEGETVEVASEDPGGFEVRSVLPDEPADGEEAEPLEPRAAAPPVALAPDNRFWIAAGVLAALTALMAWLVARRLALTPGALAAPARPRPAPLAELEERLRRVDPAAGAEPAHTALSLALRDFLGRSLGFQALESTTSEVHRRLQRTPVPAAVAQQLVRLLRDCDQVKFARLDVPPARTEDRLVRARGLARDVDAGLRPPEPLAEAAA